MNHHLVNFISFLSTYIIPYFSNVRTNSAYISATKQLKDVLMSALWKISSIFNNFVYPSVEKNRNIRAIVYKWVSRWGCLYNRPKRGKNKSGRHHAHSYHRFRDIRLRFTSLMPKTVCLTFFMVFHIYEWSIMDSQ